MSILKKFQNFREQQTRIKTILEWGRTHLDEGSFISVLPSDFKKNYQITNKKLRRTNADVLDSATLIISDSSLDVAHITNRSQFIEIFSSPYIKVLEKEKTNGPRPLRFGLEASEKDLLLGAARKTMQYFLISGNILPLESLSFGLERLMDQSVSVDVAVWIDGSLRGSSIEEQKPCLEALVTAATRVVHDGRFNPITIDELSEARIEITIWSDLYIPVTLNEVEAGTIYYDKLYLALHRGKRAWYLPEVFNCRTFKNLNEVLHSLVTVKGSFPLNKTSCYISEVIDMIDSELPSEKSFFLKGSMLNTSKQLSKENFETVVRTCAVRAAEWLISVQHQNGFISTAMDPWSSRTPVELSLPRLAHVSWALAELGMVLDRKDYTIASQKALRYVMNVVQDLGCAESQKKVAYAYAGQTAFILDEKAFIERALLGTQKTEALLFEPILFLQLASFLSKMRKEEVVIKRMLDSVKEALTLTFEHGDVVSLASYAELLDLDPDFKIKNNNSTIAEWYKREQHQDGSFPNTTSSHFSYVRGTGKIFEVMALDKVRFWSELQKSLLWLSQMQYTDTNMFFIPASRQKDFNGAFRHDMGSPVAWIDSASHVILGAARLLK